MVGLPRDGDLEQPPDDTFACTAELRDTTQLPGDVRNIAQLVGERQSGSLFLQFHDVSVSRAKKLTFSNRHWTRVCPASVW
jgi:hypothetical protein